MPKGVEEVEGDTFLMYALRSANHTVGLLSALMAPEMLSVKTLGQILSNTNNDGQSIKSLVITNDKIAAFKDAVVVASYQAGKSPDALLRLMDKTFGQQSASLRF